MSYSACLLHSLLSFKYFTGECCVVSRLHSLALCRNHKKKHFIGISLLFLKQAWILLLFFDVVDSSWYNLTLHNAANEIWIWKKCVRTERGFLCCCFDKTRTSYHHPNFNGRAARWWSDSLTFFSSSLFRSLTWNIINTLTSHQTSLENIFQLGLDLLRTIGMSCEIRASQNHFEIMIGSKAII